ncbi:MAG: hypothetical protein LC723_07840, partial [Actinobacteria bacterium]|nr:hypothetical protein [Actinomycetota bacterium]
MEEDDIPELKTSEEVAGWLALKHANGMPFKQVLDIHTLVLTRIARDYVKGWDWKGNEPSDELRKMYQWLRDG